MDIDKTIKNALGKKGKNRIGTIKPKNLLKNEFKGIKPNKILNKTMKTGFSRKKFNMINAMRKPKNTLTPNKRIKIKKDLDSYNKCKSKHKVKKDKYSKNNEEYDIEEDYPRIDGGLEEVFRGLMVEANVKRSEAEKIVMAFQKQLEKKYLY